MEIRDYWRILSKRWWIIAVVCVLATTGALGYSKLETPIFRADIRLDVSPARYDYGLTMVISDLLRQYAAQLQTDKMAELVNSKLKLDLPTDSLRSRVKISPVPEDYAIDIQVDDPDPNRAKDIAYAWADQFVQMHQEMMAPVAQADRIDVTIHDNPRPGQLSSPKTKQNALAAAILGIVVGAIFVFLLEYIDDTFKTIEDVERYTSLPVLGAIPTAAPKTKRYSAEGVQVAKAT